MSVVDANAVMGMVTDEDLVSDEPAFVGRSVASMVFGAVSANRAGVAVVA